MKIFGVPAKPDATDKFLENSSRIPREFLENSSKIPRKSLKKNEAYRENRMPATPRTLTSLKRTLTSSALFGNVILHPHFIRALMESYSSSEPSWKVFHVILEESVHEDF